MHISLFILHVYSVRIRTEFDHAPSLDCVESDQSTLGIFVASLNYESFHFDMALALELCDVK